MDSATLVLLAYAASVTGYHIPNNPPTLVPVSLQFFRARPECHADPECSIEGLFVPDENRIYLDNRLSGMYGDSVKVHELTHFLQRGNDAYLARTCENMLKREKEANRIQADYINKIQREKGEAEWVFAEDDDGLTCEDQPAERP